MALTFENQNFCEFVNLHFIIIYRNSRLLKNDSNQQKEDMLNLRKQYNGRDSKMDGRTCSLIKSTRWLAKMVAFILIIVLLFNELNQSGVTCSRKPLKIAEDYNN